MDYTNHINKYDNSAAIQAALDAGTLVNPYVAMTSAGTLDFNSLQPTPPVPPVPPTPPTPAETPLSFEVISAGTITIEGMHMQDCEIKVNDGAWSSYGSETQTSFSAGDIISLRSSQYSAGNSIINNYSSTAKYKVFGNVNSLFYDGTDAWKTSTDAHYLRGLFSYLTGLTDASELILPAMDLIIGSSSSTEHIYENMFYGCENLTAAPVLPATGLSKSCYAYMFYNCTSLTAAPALPALILADNCYESMFYMCSSLAESPVLSAATLVPECYKGMFSNCSNLTAVTCLATYISATDCTNYMCNSSSSNGVFIKSPSMTGWTYNGMSYDGIPADWKVADYPSRVEYIRFVGVLADSVGAQNPVTFDTEFPINDNSLTIEYSNYTSTAYQGPLKYFQVIARGVPMTIQEIRYNYKEICNSNGYCEGYYKVDESRDNSSYGQTYVGDTGSTHEIDDIRISIQTGGLYYGYDPVYVYTAEYNQVLSVQCDCDVCDQCPDPCTECSDPQSSQECCECQGGTWTGDASEPCQLPV
jgi:hypothetical protein